MPDADHFISVVTDFERLKNAPTVPFAHHRAYLHTSCTSTHGPLSKTSNIRRPMDNSTQLTPGKFLGFVPNTEPRVAGLGFQQLVTCVCLLLPVYAFLVSQLRFRYLQRLYQKYPYTTRESFSRMTDDEACEIQKGLVQLEFPFLYLKSLQFALFRV